MSKLKIRMIAIFIVIVTVIISFSFYVITTTISAVIYGSEEEQVIYESQPGNVIANPYYISAPYGVCGCELYVCEMCHYGIDLVSTAATPSIYAYADGTIINNGYDYAGAVMVEIDHGNNLYTWYIHMEEGTTSHLKEGNKIKKGEYIGIMGSTGFSTGAHLHFQVNVGCNMTSCSVNPASYISSNKPETDDDLDKFGTE